MRTAPNARRRVAAATLRRDARVKRQERQPTQPYIQLAVERHNSVPPAPASPLAPLIGRGTAFAAAVVVAASSGMTGLLTVSNEAAVCCRWCWCWCCCVVAAAGLWAPPLAKSSQCPRKKKEAATRDSVTSPNPPLPPRWCCGLTGGRTPDLVEPW